MVTKELFFDQITELRFHLQQTVENLNDGGCGVFCREMCLAMEKLNIPYEIVVFDDRDDLDTEKETIRNWNKGIKDDYIYHTSPSHICLRVFDKLFDGYDSHWQITQEWVYDPQYKEFKYDLEELLTVVDHAGWNKKFNKKYEDTIKQSVSDYILVPLLLTFKKQK